MIYIAVAVAAFYVGLIAGFIAGGMMRTAKRADIEMGIEEEV